MLYNKYIKYYKYIIRRNEMVIQRHTSIESSINTISSLIIFFELRGGEHFLRFDLLDAFDKPVKNMYSTCGERVLLFFGIREGSAAGQTSKTSNSFTKL
jgi:hypothetical protein